jgi:hypothetical protein
MRSFFESDIPETVVSNTFNYYTTQNIFALMLNSIATQSDFLIDKFFNEAEEPGDD